MIALCTVLYRSTGAFTETLPSWLQAMSRCTADVQMFVLLNPSNDPASDQAVRELLNSRRHAPVSLIEAESNVGFAAGMNRLRESATGARHLLLVNPDVSMDPELLSDIAMWTEAYPRDIGVLPLLSEGQTRVGTGLSRALLFGDVIDASVRPRTARRLFRARLGPSGGGCVIPATVWDDVKGFDPAMFAWGEDVDFGIRAILKGHIAREVPTRASPHSGGHSIHGSREDEKRKAQLLARNRCWIWARYTTIGVQVLLAPLWAAFAALNVLQHIPRRTARATARGYIAGAHGWRQQARSSRCAGSRLGVEELLEVADAASKSDWFRPARAAPTPTLSSRNTGRRPDGVSIVIVTYNAVQFLERCLRSIQAQAEVGGVEVLVVDNHSTDGTPAAAEALGASVVELCRNSGYARAVNEGLARRQFDDVLILNPDTFLSDRQVLAQSLAELRSLPSVGAMGVRLVREDGRVDHACLRRDPTVPRALGYFTGLDRLGVWRSRFGSYIPSPSDYLTRVESADAINGAFMLIRGEVMDRLGGFDTSYWMYGEDLDLCRRTRDAGYTITYDGTQSAVHLKGASSGTRRSLRVDYAFHDAMWRYWRAHTADGWAAPIAWTMIWLKFIAGRLRRLWER